MLIGATAYALGMLAVPMSEAPELEDYRCHEIKALVRRGISAADAAEYIPEAAGCPSGLIEQLKTLARGQAATGKRDGVTLVVATLPRRPPRVQTDPSSLRGASHGHEGRPTVTPPNQSPTRPAPELVQSHAPPPPPPPPPAPAPARAPLEPDNPDIVVHGKVEARREFPSRSSCDDPAVGWIGLVETGSSERRVTFDGGPPVERTPRPNRVPDLGDTLVFSDQWPANLFSQSVPCYVEDLAACQTSHAAGTFVVVQRVRYNAGPRGGSRWQLCLVRERDIGYEKREDRSGLRLGPVQRGRRPGATGPA